MGIVVSEWHNAERTADDKNAYKTKASKKGLGISGFNLFCRIYLQVLNDDRTPVYYHNIKATYSESTGTVTITGSATETDNAFVVNFYNKNGSLIASESGTCESGTTTIDFTTTTTFDEKPEYAEIIDANQKANGETGYYAVTTS